MLVGLMAALCSAHRSLDEMQRYLVEHFLDILTIEYAVRSGETT